MNNDNVEKSYLKYFQGIKFNSNNNLDKNHAIY